MKKVLIVIILLVLLGCATGLIFTYQSLSATRDLLQETKTALYETQVKQQDTAKSLEETQNELQNTTQNLEETTQGLLDQKSQTEKYIQLYESNLEELEDMEGELDTVAGELASSQQTNRELQQAIDEIQDKLDLYEDTLGTQVFSRVLPPYNTGYLSDLTLTNNNTAKNPTWKELIEFLQEDKTDKHLYITDVYMCGSFAQDLHNNAEARGIRAAFVAVHFYNSENHALNAFKTVDKGLVYIDVTGGEYPITLSNLDKKVEMKKDELYREYLLFPDAGWGLSQGASKVKSIEIYW
jgi:uncharacterized protein YxeA